MIDFIDILLQKRRLLIACAFVAVDLLLLVLLGSVAQRHHVNTSSHSQTTVTKIIPDNSYDDSNAVTNALSTGINDLGQVASTSGQKLSAGLESFAIGVAHSSGVIGHAAGTGVVFVLHGVATGFGAVFHVVGSGFTFVGHTFGAVFGFVGHVTHANVLIRPTDDRPAPAIDNNLSAVLARSTAQAQLAAYVKQKSSDVVAAQLAANQKLDGSVVAGDPNHGGYPTKWDYPARQDSLVDNWGMYNRECVSYAAWKVYQTFGSMPYWGGVGNANQWPADARGSGIPTGSSPKVHTVAISLHGYYGHAMWVEAVNGNMIYVSQYNYDLAGHYSEMWVNGSSFTYIYFK